MYQAARSLGAAVPTNILRLQNALVALGRRKNDPALMISVDGLVGPQTVNATRRALITYVVAGAGSAPANWGRTLTTSTLRANATEIAGYIERAAGISPPAAQGDDGLMTPASLFPVPSTPSAPTVQHPGGSMPAYQPQPQYYPPTQYAPPVRAYPPQGYGPARGPGDLPTDRATLDVKAFIPAQYEHVSISPFVGIALIIGVVSFVYVIKQHKIVAK